MKTRVRLLIRKVWFAGFSWEELENYLGKAKDQLIQELKTFFKEIPEAADGVMKTIQLADENSRRKQATRTVCLDQER